MQIERTNTRHASSASHQSPSKLDQIANTVKVMNQKNHPNVSGGGSQTANGDFDENYDHGEDASGADDN